MPCHWLHPGAPTQGGISSQQQREDRNWYKHVSTRKNEEGELEFSGAVAYTYQSV